MNEIISNEEPIRRIYIKKKKEVNEIEEVNTNINVNVYEKKIIKHQASISSDKPIYISKRYLPTKIKIYKCLIYKNFDPNVNEETIKTAIKRNGSHMFDKGGFFFKLNK